MNGEGVIYRCVMMRLSIGREIGDTVSSRLQACPHQDVKVISCWQKVYLFTAMGVETSDRLHYKARNLKNTASNFALP